MGFLFNAIRNIFILIILIFGILYVSFKMDHVTYVGSFIHKFPEYGNFSIHRDTYGIPHI